MIGLLKNKSQYYTDFFFLVRDSVQYKEFLLFTQELIHFTQEILPLLPKKLRTSNSRNLKVPNDGYVITGNECDPHILTFVLRLREKPRKNLNQEIDPTGNGTRSRCLRCNDVTPSSQR